MSVQFLFLKLPMKTVRSQSPYQDIGTLNQPKKLFELDKKDLSLHIAAVREKGREIYLGEDEYDLSDLDDSLLRNEIFEKLKKISILTTKKYLQTWKIVQDASMSTSIKIHKHPTLIFLKTHSLYLLVLPIIHSTNIDILKIWSIDYI